MARTIVRAATIRSWSSPGLRHDALAEQTAEFAKWKARLPEIFDLPAHFESHSRIQLMWDVCGLSHTSVG
jgi:hypothetical protein